MPSKTASGDTFVILPLQAGVSTAFPELPLVPFLKAGGELIFETLTLNTSGSSATDGEVFFGAGANLPGLLPVDLFVEGRYQFILGPSSTQSVFFAVLGVKL